MKMSTSAVRTHTISVAECSPLLVNYDPIIKSMRKPAEVQYKQLCNASFRAMTVPSLEIIIILLCCCFSLSCFLLQCMKQNHEVTGTLNDVLSQILVNLKPHDYKAWRCQFEDTFGVEIDTSMKEPLCKIKIIIIIRPIITI
uniref:Chloride channel CLIC-like protein 1 n=1 Tax=Oncorhynchus kisutch TaxID=8019 RepID=A0A8C7IXN0_ONCKI